MSDMNHSTCADKVIKVTPHPKHKRLMIHVHDPHEYLLDLFQQAADEFDPDGKYRWNPNTNEHHYLLSTTETSAETVHRHFADWYASVIPAARAKAGRVAPTARVVQPPQPPRPPQVQNPTARHRKRVQSKPATAQRRKSTKRNPTTAQQRPQKSRPQSCKRPAVHGSDMTPAKRKRTKGQQTQLPVVLTLRERWDTEMLAWCARSEGLDPGIELSHLDPEGYLTVPYGWVTQEDKVPCGRLLAQVPAAQRARSTVRRLAQHKYYHDIDQVNSGPTLIWNLCRVQGLRCPALSAYVTQREQCLAQLAQWGMDRETGKGIMQKLCYGASLSSLGQVDRRVVGTLENFARELKGIRRALLRSPLCDKLRARMKKAEASPDEKEEEPNDLSLFATLVFEFERRATLCIMDFFQGKGYPPGVLVGDGAQVERQVAGSSDAMDEALLRACETYIQAQTGLRLQLKEKSMQPTEADWTLLRNAPRTLATEHDAAHEVALMLTANGVLVHTVAGIAVFEPDCGTFSLDQERNVKEILPKLLAPVAHRLQGTAQHYLHQVHARKNMYNMLHSVLPVDVLWLDRSMERTRLKLCFQDGYWDFATQQFHRGSFPQLGFLQGLKSVFPEHQPEWVARVREEIFSRPYRSPAVRDFVLIALARALAGDQAAKRGYFILGKSNSGKGMLTHLIEEALAGVATTFNASCLCKDSSDDPAKDLGWVMPLWSQRLVVANEFNARARDRSGQTRPQLINNNVWKSVVSGGTDKIHCRLLYQNAIAVTPQFTPFIFANDMPAFDNPGDSGVQTRTVATYMDRSAATTEPVGPDQFPADPTLRQRLLQPAYQAGFVWLLLESFEHFRQHGHELPPEIQDATAERVPSDGAWAALLEHYVAWDAETKRLHLHQPAQAIAAGWSVRTREVYQVIREAGIHMSPVAVGEELRRRGIVKHKTRTQGQVFVGLRKPEEAQMAAAARVFDDM